MSSAGSRAARPRRWSRTSHRGGRRAPGRRAHAGAARLEDARDRLRARAATPVITIPWGDVATAFHSTGIPNIEVYLAPPAGTRAIAQGSAASSARCWRGRVQALLKRRIRARPRGPDRRRSGPRAHRALGRGADGAGARAVSRLDGPGGLRLHRADRAGGRRAGAGGRRAARLPDAVARLRARLRPARSPGRRRARTCDEAPRPPRSSARGPPGSPPPSPPTRRGSTTRSSRRACSSTRSSTSRARWCSSPPPSCWRSAGCPSSRPTRSRRSVEALQVLPPRRGHLRPARHLRRGGDRVRRGAGAGGRFAGGDAPGGEARTCARPRTWPVATGYYDHPNLLGVPGEDLPHVSHYYTEPHAYCRSDVVVVGGKNSAAIAALELYRAGAAR